MEFRTIQEAKNSGLMQLTEWLQDNIFEREFLKREIDRIIKNPERIVMPVKSNGRIAVFVDRIAGHKGE